jgi:Fe-coproporphyrin III synthase
MAPGSELASVAMRTDGLPSGFLPERIVHLHPTRRCNLACSHCYSASSPQQDAGLDDAQWRLALPRLRAEGYQQISLSGGEPLVYPGLAELVACARGEGFRVTMVSNGLLAAQAQGRIDAVLDQLDGIAISFDGLAARHDAMRGRPDAFDRASQALARLADRGRPVAAAISVTRDGLPELPDLADHLAGLGARALQIRPVAAAGRAQDLAGGLIASDIDALRLYLVVMALAQEMAPQVRVHGDLAPARPLWLQRDAYAGLLVPGQRAAAERPALSDLVNPLVVTETGQMKPVAYDMHPSLNIGHLHRLHDAAWMRRYAAHGVSPLQRLVGHALLALEDDPGVVDWFDTLARASQRHALALRPVVSPTAATAAMAAPAARATTPESPAAPATAAPPAAGRESPPPPRSGCAAPPG